MKVVCLFCGFEKPEILGECDFCGKMPAEENEIVISILLNDQFTERKDLDAIADRIKKGLPLPKVSSEAHDFLVSRLKKLRVRL